MIFAIQMPGQKPANRTAMDIRMHKGGKTNDDVFRIFLFFD